MHPGTLTFEERERIALCSNDPQHALLAELADRVSVEDMLGAAETHIDEALTQFPAEGFLAPTIDKLRAFAKGMHLVNKAYFLGLVAELDQVATDTQNSADYGREELSKALANLRGEA